MSDHTRVMVVDDHDSFRQPFAFMIGREPDLMVIAQADSVAAATAALDKDKPVDVAVVDLDLPDGSGTDFVRALHGIWPRTPALILSAVSEQRQIAQAIEAGAAGILHKSIRLEEILGAIRRLRDGELLLSQEEIIESLRFVARERESEIETRLKIEKLTSRELDVLRAVAEGSGDKEISQRLHIGVGTVHSHVTNIMSKLEVQSRLQALVIAVRYGIVKI